MAHPVGSNPPDQRAQWPVLVLVRMAAKVAREAAGRLSAGCHVTRAAAAASPCRTAGRLRFRNRRRQQSAGRCGMSATAIGPSCWQAGFLGSTSGCLGPRRPHHRRRMHTCILLRSWTLRGAGQSRPGDTARSRQPTRSLFSFGTRRSHCVSLFKRWHALIRLRTWRPLRCSGRVGGEVIGVGR